MPYNTKLKDRLIEQFGGGCQTCGYNKCHRALAFHHIDNSEKKLYQNPNSPGRVSFQEVLDHPERFILLCANCHLEEHARLHDAAAHWVGCQHCGKLFKVQLNTSRIGHGKYCSNSCHIAHRPIVFSNTLVPRFWKNVQRTDTCWIWTGYAYNGTPMLNSGHELPGGKHSPVTARQVSYRIAFGKEPSFKLTVSCGNKMCVNPEHLIPFHPIAAKH